MTRNSLTTVSSSTDIWQLLQPWLLPQTVLLVWELASRVGWLSSRVLPEPWADATAFWRLLSSGELWQHVAISSGRALAGLALGGGLGLQLGLLTGSFQVAERLLDTTLQMLRNIPALALIPLETLWVGIDESAKLFLVAVRLPLWNGVRSPVFKRQV